MKQGNEVSNLETNAPGVTQNQTDIPQQPVEGTAGQPPTEPTPPQKTSKKWLLPGLMGLIIILLGTTSYLAYQNHRLKQPTAEEESSRPVQQIAKEPESPQKENKTSELVSIDSKWNKYTNYQLGFSMLVPKVVTTYKQCQSPEKLDREIGIYEDKDKVYITTKEMVIDFSSLANPYGECKIKETDLHLLNYYYSPPYPIKTPLYRILSEEAFNDQDIESFLKEHFGPACSIGKKTAKENGVIEIKINPNNPEEAFNMECLVNFAYVVLYHPDKNKIFSWIIGQEPVFQKQKQGESYESYDEEMLNSFTFL